MTQSRAPIMDTTLGSGAMFDAIARRYALLNRVMSFGSDQRWRRRTVRALELRPGVEVLDVATGTADLAIACARAGARVTGVDPSAGMLEVGERKTAKSGDAFWIRGPQRVLKNSIHVIRHAVVAKWRQ